jgi:Flp pilus assembly pilin Flp
VETLRVGEFLKDEDGQDMVEYSLLLGFIALAALGILTSAGSSVKTLWNDLSNALTSATATAS